MKKFILPVLAAAVFGVSLMAAADTAGEGKGKKDCGSCCKDMKDCKDAKAKDAKAAKPEAPKA